MVVHLYYHEMVPVVAPPSVLNCKQRPQVLSYKVCRDSIEKCKFWSNFLHGDTEKATSTCIFRKWFMCLHFRQFLIVNNNLKADVLKFAEIPLKNVNFGVVLVHFCTEKVTSTCIIRKWFNFLLLRQLQTVNKVPKVHLAR